MKHFGLLLIFCCLFMGYLLKLTSPKDHCAVDYTLIFLSEKLVSRYVFIFHSEEPAFALQLHFSVSASTSGKQVLFAQEFYFHYLFPHFIVVSTLPPHCIYLGISEIHNCLPVLFPYNEFSFLLPSYILNTPSLTSSTTSRGWDS